MSLKVIARILMRVFATCLLSLGGLSPALSQSTTSAGQPKCKVYFSIETAPHALTDWLYTRQVRWRFNVAQPWADGLKRAKLTPPTADEVTAAHDKLQQQIAAYRPPDRPPIFFNGSTSYKPVQYWPFDATETAQLENWLRKDGLKKYPGLCLSAEHSEYILAIAMAKGGLRECGYTPRGICHDFNNHSPAVLLYRAQSPAPSGHSSAYIPAEFSVLGPMGPGEPFERTKRLLPPMLKYLIAMK